MVRKIILYLIVGLSLFASEFEKSIDIGSVKHLVFDGYGEVNISKGDENSLVVYSNREKAIKEIVVDESYRSLYIEYKGDKLIDFKPVTIKVDLVFKKLDEVELRGASNVNIIGFEGKNLKLTVKGSGKVDLEGLDYNNYNIVMSGASHIVAKGSGKKASIDISGAGNFFGEELLLEKVDINLRGAGVTTVYATELLSGELSGLGSIKYFGKPERVDVELNGLGRIKEGE